jgi:hypothetical protein
VSFIVGVDSSFNVLFETNQDSFFRVFDFFSLQLVLQFSYIRVMTVLIKASLLFS